MTTFSPLSETALRRCFINASRSESAAITFPAGFTAPDLSTTPVFGWRDPKLPLRAYLIVEDPASGAPAGVLLRAPDTSAGRKRRVVCALCEDIHSEDDVLMYVARRAGSRGRNGDSVGTLIHADFGCSRNAVAEPPANALITDPEQAAAERLAALRRRAGMFLDRVRS